MFDRRRFIAASGAALSAALPFSLSNAARAAAPIDAPYAPLLTSPTREIRTVVGLRPYRRTGFRLEAEKFGRRTVIHNYGHGGGGVTLSWGCAELAVKKAMAVSNARKAAVIGAGALGLTTAWQLMIAGYEVAIYAGAYPPETTSNIAGAYWDPAGVFSRSAVDARFMATFRDAARRAQRRFQHLVNDPAYGVRWMRMNRFHNDAEREFREPAEGIDMYPGRTVFRAPDANAWDFGARERYFALMIDPDIFLRRLLRDLQQGGVKTYRREFTSADDIFDVKERLIFNCTGLGARALFGDDALEPVRGQLTLLLPQPEIDYGYVHYSRETGLLYMFPRQSSIVLGGSSDRGDWSLEARTDDHERMLTGNAAMAARINAAQLEHNA